MSEEHEHEQQPEEKTVEAKWTVLYKVVDRFGLPTAYLLVVTGLMVFAVRVLYIDVVTPVKNEHIELLKNTIKAQESIANDFSVQTTVLKETRDWAKGNSKLIISAEERLRVESRAVVEALGKLAERIK